MLSIREITSDRDAFNEWYVNLSAEDKSELARALDGAPRVGPVPGPQMLAFNSSASVVGFGGAGGGGKSALICILAICSHRRSVIFRAEAAQMKSLLDDLIEFIGSDDGLNRQNKVFRFQFGRDVNGNPINRMVEWGGLSKPGDENAWRGRPHDFIAFDEATEIPEDKVNFVSAWNRTTVQDQNCRVLMTFNPPGVVTDDMVSTGVDGRWVIDYFSPWLDEMHENPAKPGELRWYIRNDNGEQEEVPNGQNRELHINGKVYVTKPKSKTFIPSLVTDNPYLTGTGYEAHLLSLEEPLRSQMLGSFRSGIKDQDRQMIPSEWVDKAMERWTPAGRHEPMSALGADVARGGSDNAVIARRHGFWWDDMLRKPGAKVSDGGKMATFCLEAVKDSAFICLDAVAVGSSPYDILKGMGVPLIGVVGSRQKGLMRIDTNFEMFNMRTWVYWLLRKVLDPANGINPCLPKDKRLRRQLVAATYDVQGGKYAMEPKVSVRKRLGFSPDEADAVAMSLASLSREELPGADKLLSSRKIDMSAFSEVAAEHQPGFFATTARQASGVGNKFRWMRG